MNALIYARQSSGCDDHSESVETQIENCRRLAVREKLNVIGIFSDLNTSGKTYPAGAEQVAENDKAFLLWFEQQTGTRKYRSGLGKIFERLSETDFLIVDEMTRLYRPVTRSFLESYVNQKLAENHVQILQCKGGRLDLNQFDQQLIQTLKNQIQDEAIANQKKKSKEQFRKLRDSGYKCNGAKMFGIRYLGNRKLEVIPECAEVIRFIYNSIADYVPYSAIIRQVNQKYRHCFRRYCYESNFYAIARQPIYCGYQYNSCHELIPNVQMTGQEIISFQMWKKVNDILDCKKKEPPLRTKKHWLPMSGKLFCGFCGSRLTCQIDRGVIFYICNKNNLSPSRGCSRSRIRFLSSGDVNCLYEITCPLLLIGLEERLRRNLRFSENRARLAVIRQEFESMQENERRIFDFFSRGIISEDQLENMLKEYRAKRLSLHSEILLLKEISQKDLEEERKRFPRLFVLIRNRKLDHTVYEQLFRETVRRADVYESRVEFSTIAGNISIPRIREKKRNFFPEWEIRIPDGMAADNFFSPGHSPAEVIFFCSGPEILLRTEHFVFKTEKGS